MTNEFIIGLGGAGGSSIRAFRRACVERKDDVAAMKERGVKFEYLYVDSNNDILKEAGWTVFGENVELNPADVVSLKTAGTPLPSVKTISGLKNVSPWIGSLEERYKKKIGSEDGESVDTSLRTMDGAGQLRRFGRVLFALNPDAVRKAVIRKNNAFLTERAEKTINYRIFCTLGGGTGSGSLIDMITMLKTISQESKFSARIFVYVYVAGPQGGEFANSGSFYENEYSCLRDLNALMTRKYHPYVVGRQRDLQQGNEFDDECPVTQVFLSSELSPVSQKLPAQIEGMAKACFDNIAYNTFYSNRDCLKVVTGEDLIQHNPGEGQRILRSYRFAAYASRRWCVPTAQIKECLKYDYECSVLNCWLGDESQKYNSDDVLKKEYKLIDGAVVEVLKDKKVEILGPLAARVKSIKDNNRRDPKVLQDLRETCSAVTAKVRGIQNDSSFMSRLDNAYEKDAEAYVDSICSGIDAALQWQSGINRAWGLKQVQDFLTKHCDQLATALSSTLMQKKKYDEDLDGNLETNMKNREAEWDKLGFLTIHLTNLDEKMIEWQEADAQSRVENAMRHFTEQVYDELSNRITLKLSALKNRVKNAIDDITNRLDSVGTLRDQILGDLNMVGNSRDVYEYDSELLQKVRNAMASRQKELHDQMATVYSVLWQDHIKSLKSYTLAEFDTVYHEIDSSLAYKSSAELHDKVINENGWPSVLVANIIGRLGDVGGATPADWSKRLLPKVRNFLSNLATSVSIADIDGLTDPQRSPATAMVIGFPKAAKGSPLRTWLESALKENISGNFPVYQERMDTYEHCSPQEIRVLYIPAWMPARFATVVDELYDRYKQSVQSDEGLIKAYFSNIDDDDNGLDSQNRPPLTLGGDPDAENAMKVEIAQHLVERISAEKTKAILLSRAEGFQILQRIDENGIAQYSKPPYPDSMRAMPSDKFKKELDAAITRAKKSMTDDDKKKVIDVYLVKLRELDDAELVGTREYDKVNELYNFARKLLGIK